MGEGASQAELAIGAVVSGHRIVRHLGAGGFGAVFEAIDLSLDRPVALKLLHGAEAGMMARFRDEARLLARINDPHVIQIYRIDQLPSGQPFLTMELFGTGALGKHVPRGKPAPLHFAVAVVRQVLAALAAAHAGGIVHRDIKEANILVDPARMAVKVCDFGIARAQNPGDREAPATGHAVLGTPHYIAPERFRGTHDDPRSDLYSVGVVFYRMLCGRRPFDMSGASVFEIAHRVVSEDAPPLRGVPPAVAQVCLNLLARDPQDRPANAWSAIAALDRAIEGPATELEMAVIRRFVPAGGTASGAHSGPVVVAGAAPVVELSAVLDIDEVGAAVDESLAFGSTASAPPEDGERASVSTPGAKPLTLGPTAPGLPGTSPLAAPSAARPAQAAVDGRVTLVGADPQRIPQAAAAAHPSPPARLGQPVPAAEPDLADPTASSAVLAWEATDSALGDTEPPARFERLGGWWGLGLGAVALALLAWGLNTTLGAPEVSDGASAKNRRENDGLRNVVGATSPALVTAPTDAGPLAPVTAVASEAAAALGATALRDAETDVAEAVALDAEAVAEAPSAVDAAIVAEATLAVDAEVLAADAEVLAQDAGPSEAGPADAGAPDAQTRDGFDAEATAPEAVVKAAVVKAAAPVQPPKPPAVAAKPTVRSKPARKIVASGRPARPAAPASRPATTRGTAPTGEDRRKARSQAVYDDPFVVPGN